MPRRRRAIPDDTPSNHGGGDTDCSPPPALAEALLDAIGLVAPGLVGPADAAEDKSQSTTPGVSMHGLRLTPPWKIEDPELRRLCARAVLEARCGRLWFCRRPVTIEGRRGCWLETVVLGEDGVPLDRSNAFRLPWREARRHAHAAVLIDITTQAPVRCLWRGRPDLPKGLKLAAAAGVLEEIEREPTR